MSSILQLCWLLAILFFFFLRDFHSNTAAEASNVTRITRNSKETLLLRRRKRYLTFPTGSNLVLTMSFVKAVMQKQPKGYNVIGECDVPFPLPKDTRMFVKQQIHKRQKREMYFAFEDAFQRMNLNGTACLDRFICDAQDYVFVNTKHSSNSLVRDLLFALFTIPAEEKEQQHVAYCSRKDQYCEISLFNYMINSLRN